jgi:hypothetical protein
MLRPTNVAQTAGVVRHEVGMDCSVAWLKSCMCSAGVHAMPALTAAMVRHK